MAAKKAMVHTQKTISQNLVFKMLGYLANFYFCRTFNNKDFKMQVERTNFVTHLIITVKRG